MKNINIIIVCEESQEICKAFRERGFNAFSCDMQPCSGGYPQYHLQGDARFYVYSYKWHMLIGHPPCTRLTNSVIWYIKKYDLWHEVEEAAEFFNFLLDAPVDHILMENPVQHGYARKFIRKYDQIIQPYQFNEDASKATCLWMKNLPPLQYTGYYPPRIVNGKKRWSNQTDGGWNKLPPSPDRGKLRSKTYPGIARAIAEQYGGYLLSSTQNK